MPKVVRDLVVGAISVWIALVVLNFADSFLEKMGGPVGSLAAKGRKLATPGSN